MLSERETLSDYCLGLPSRNNLRFFASLRMTAPDISVRNRQRKIPVNVADLEIFAGKALRRCLRLQQAETDGLG